MLPGWKVRSNQSTSLTTSSTMISTTWTSCGECRPLEWSTMAWSVYSRSRWTFNNEYDGLISQWWHYNCSSFSFFYLVFYLLIIKIDQILTFFQSINLTLKQHRRVISHLHYTSSSQNSAIRKWEVYRKIKHFSCNTIGSCKITKTTKLGFSQCSLNEHFQFYLWYSWFFGPDS